MIPAMTVAASEEYPRHIATYMNTLPQEEGVTWGEDVAAEMFDTAYETVTISDQDGNAYTVEVIPKNLVYYIDSESNQPSEDTPPYLAVKALEDGLKNESTDQVYVEGETLWGLSGDVRKKSYTEAAFGDKQATGLYGAVNAADQTISYKLYLEAGNYTFTSGHREWWGADRPMKVTVTHDGTTETAAEIHLSKDNKDEVVNKEITVAEAQTVTYSVTSTGSQAPVISWLAVAENVKAIPGGMTEALEDIGEVAVRNGALLVDDLSGGKMVSVTSDWISGGNSVGDGGGVILSADTYFRRPAFTMYTNIMLDGDGNEKSGMITIGTTDGSFKIRRNSDGGAVLSVGSVNGDSYAGTEYPLSADFSDGKWYALGITYQEDQTQGYAAVYVNGGKVSEDIALGFKLSEKEGIIAGVGIAFKTGFMQSGSYDNIRVSDFADSQAATAETAARAEGFPAGADDLLFERMFRVKAQKNGQFVTGAGGVKADGSAAENILVLRYGDEYERDVLDKIPAALYFETTGKYLVLGTSARQGTKVSLNAALTRDGAEQFLLEKAEDWSSDNLSYYLYHPQSGLYIGMDENQSLYAYGKTKPNTSFLFEKSGYSPVGLLTTLPGYAELSEAEKERVLDVYGGVGAKSLFRRGGLDTEWTVENALRETVTSIYENRDATTPEEQAEAIRNGMALKVYSGQTNYYNLPDLPGTTGLKTELSEGEAGTYDFWRGTMMSGKKYTFSIIDEYGTHTMTIYIQDDSTAQKNAENLMEAIKQIPYPLRRNIKTIRVRKDNANNYNCGQNDLYMRLNWTQSVNAIAQYLTHEFGHSMDFSYNVNGSKDWEKAMAADILKVSDYGSNNGYEDFADFGRLYFQQYGNYNAMYALRQLYPNRYRVYTRTLLSAQYEDVYEKYLYRQSAQEEERYTGVLARFTFDDPTEGLVSSRAIAVPAKTVMLEENGKSGKALRLDGTASNFLKVQKKDHTSLLKGYDEFTISYYSKPEKGKASWSVFLAPDENAQTYKQERYIGILDTSSQITAERYNNYGSRSEALKTEGLSNQDWRYVTLVVEKDRTTVYVDGMEKGSVESQAEVQDILGNNSVFQIGKGNWNSGEYYQGLIDELTVYGRALSKEEIQAEIQKEPLADFTFDNDQEGFCGKGAAASGNGRYQFAEDAVSGKSLYLDGNGFLKLTKEDGTPLMTGCDEMTISYYSKAAEKDKEWTLFLAADEKEQKVNTERYVGILDGSETTTVERYHNSGTRPASITAANSKGSEWKHVVVVLEDGMTTLYVDGERVSYLRSDYRLSELTGDNSILQVGKANWGNGEFFRGYIDEMTIWGTALSSQEVDAYLARRTSTPTPTPTPPEKPLVFEDVHEDDWFYESVNYVSKKGIMTGMKEGIFNPEGDLSRGQFVTVLYRMAGSPEVAFSEKFSDVAEGEFYAKAVMWANENKIATGYADTGLFSPDKVISREELAVMMQRYASYCGQDVTADDVLPSYTDGACVSEFAKSSMSWAVANQIIRGADGKLLNPQGKAKRAECAAMLQRWLETM